jgi:chromosome segregation ATPase
LILAAEGTNIAALILGSGALVAAAAAWFKAPTDKDVAKRGISVEESAEIRATLKDTLDQVQEERDGARAEARLLRAEVRECRGDCDAVRKENDELKVKLAASEARVAALERQVLELQTQLEALQ